MGGTYPTTAGHQYDSDGCAAKLKLVMTGLFGVALGGAVGIRVRANAMGKGTVSHGITESKEALLNGIAVHLVAHQLPCSSGADYLCEALYRWL